MEQEHDQELVNRACRGQIEAFNALVGRHQGVAYNVAARMLGDHALAEDALQEALLSAHRGLAGFRGGNFRSWFLRIVANTCRDMRRSSRRRPSVSLDDPDLGPGAVLLSSQPSPEEHALRQEVADAIQQGLSLLPEDQRLVLVLVDLQGFSYEEAAEVLSTRLGTVKSRLARGRLALKEYLLQREELLPPELRLRR